MTDKSLGKAAGSIVLIAYNVTDNVDHNNDNG